MKKLFSKLMLVALAVATFTACEDVPEPYDIPGTGDNQPGTSTEIEGATGTGTLEDPFNAIAAINYGNKLASGEESTDYYFIKGKVVSIKEEFTTQYGNGTFYISEDGTAGNQFYAYRVLYLGNKKFTASDEQIKVGDEVIVCGIITNYNGTVETAQNKGFLYSLNGVNRGGEPQQGTTSEPSGDGTLESPYNAAAAIAFAQQTGEAESADVYIKGKVASINEQYGTQYGNATFTISDDGTTTSTTFTVYRALYLGNKKYTSGDLLKEGDDVVIYGKVTNFRGNTPETVTGKAYLYSLNGKTEGNGNPNPDPQPGDVKKVTVAEFIAAEVSNDVWYQLTGKVTNLKSGDQYGNFDLVDETGSVYVYGLLSEKGGQKQKFQELVAAKGIVEGCTLTIIGNRGYYEKDNKIEVVNAYFVSIEGGGEPGDGGGETPGGSTVTSLTNGDFESWTDGLPTGWKSASTASSATLSQSTDAHGGSYSVNINGKESSNVRLATQEITLAAGTYTFSFYAKATTADVAQVRPGYVPVTNGSVGSYAYGNYATINNEGWTQVTHEFTLNSETTLCLVVMNPKKSNYSSGKDVLVDDATLTKK